jgi:hypothetical protein
VVSRLGNKKYLKYDQKIHLWMDSNLGRPNLLITSCNVVFVFLAHNTRFEAVIDKTNHILNQERREIIVVEISIQN